MIRFIPITSYEKTKELYKGQAIPFSEKAFAMAALEGERTKGFCLFSFADEKVNVLDLQVEDEDEIFIIDGLFRAAMNFALNRGMISAIVKNPSLHRLFGKMDYFDVTKSGEFQLEQFFDKHKNCGK